MATVDLLVITTGVAVTSLALLFDYTNGFNDSGSIVAAMISSGAMSLRQALVMAACFEFVGAYFLGTAVAEMIGKGIVELATLTAAAIAAALVGAIAWNYMAWYLGLPASSSHALIGGLLGASLMASGTRTVYWWNVSAVYLVLIISPLIGFAISYVLTKAHLFLFQRVPPSQANRAFNRLQVFSSVALALSHGTNDAQKTMAIITMVLTLLYPLAPATVAPFYTPTGSDAFAIPRWVTVTCASVLSLGVATGGLRILRTLGTGFYRIRPLHGFTSLSSAAAVIYGASLLGFPVSTTQISSSSILGAGAAQRVNAVRWGTVAHMVAAWIVTIPASAIVAAACEPLLSRLIPVGP